MFKQTIRVGGVYEDQTEDWVYIDTKENGIYRGQSFTGNCRWYDKYGQELEKDGVNLILDEGSELKQYFRGVLSSLLFVTIFAVFVAILFQVSYSLSK